MFLQGTKSEVRKMLKKIYEELVLIRKELQAIRSNLESNYEVVLNEKTISQSVRKAIRDTVRVDGCSS